MAKNLLTVNNLTTVFNTKKEQIPAVENVSFSIKAGETLGIVGESGSGKSVTALSIMRLISEPGEIIDGEIILEDQDLLQLSESEMRKIRGNKISMVFQEPMTSLNPVFTIGNQLVETILSHQKISKQDAKNLAIQMLKNVNIPSPEDRLKQYPHQLSGGMRQRVVIAMALACRPKLLIADEPTTALDVTTQAQILQLIKELKEKMNTSVMLITHNMGVVAAAADQVIVMYCGRIVEYADVKTIFRNPQHPYTVGLLQSIPKMNEKQEKLYSIKGSVPMPGEIKQGCRFKTRCQFASKRCMVEEPPLIKKGNSLVRCWNV